MLKYTRNTTLCISSAVASRYLLYLTVDCCPFASGDPESRIERTPQASKQNRTNSNHLALICLSDKPFKISGLSDRFQVGRRIASRIFPIIRPLSGVVNMMSLATAELRSDGSINVNWISSKLNDYVNLTSVWTLKREPYEYTNLKIRELNCGKNRECNVEILQLGKNQTQ